MFQYTNALQYLGGEWLYVDIGHYTINEVILQSKYTLINISSSEGTLHYLDRDALLRAPDKRLTITAYVAALGGTLPKVKEEVYIHSSSYRDLTEVTTRGTDLYVNEDVPFVISKLGIDRSTLGIVPALYNRLTLSGDFTLGTFDVGLSYKITQLTSSDFTSKLELKNNFRFSNSFIVFGDSLIKFSKLFDDKGTFFKFKEGWEKMFVDLYIDNINKIPPTQIGMSGNSILKSTLLDPYTVKKILTNHNVFIVTYSDYFPLGESYINVVNEWIDDHYTDVIMYNNKPTTNKVIHTRLGYSVKDILVTENVRHYNDNYLIKLTRDDEVYVKRTPQLYSVEYPVINFDI